MFFRFPWLAPLLILVLGAIGYAYVSSLPVNPSSQPQPRVSSRAQSESGFLLIRGAFVIIGKSPDGDSVRFVPDDAALLSRLKNAYRVKPSKDGSVQLRFEAIDTPELHFGDDAQPLGREARDVLLKRMGFTNVRFQGKNDTVASSQPERVRGAILSQAAEGNGRPISYAFLEKDVGTQADGSRVKVEDALLRKTLNFAMIQNGMAYLTVYSSTVPAHREFFKTAAREARAKRLGVWAVDKTAQFTLQSQDSLAPGGQLVLPKLFRRCTSYLQDLEKRRFDGNLVQWLQNGATGSRPEDDEVLIGSRKTRLSNLLEVRGKTVRFNADLLEIVFLEK
jgi:endonuclease YncB( thermonuclease family)